MADCKCIEKCPFFNDKMGGKPSTAKLMKKQYCLGDFEECARFIVFTKLGSGGVPADLFPSMKDRALSIINS